ncbi:hypothetical protein [Kitasatospora sp. NPDC002040]|uniref:hypothetical protein n=1 Tax=Kitasatospora sp. NPDC002040 TaxID=3154661 RepID=UPI00332FF04F
MSPDDLFVETPSPDIEGFTFKRLNHELMDRLRQGPLPQYRDADVAHQLVFLVEEDIGKSDMDSSLGSQGTAAVLRTLDILLGRLGISARLPFRTKQDYWTLSGSGTWGSGHRGISQYCSPVLEELADLERRTADSGYRGVNGDLRNIIFAVLRKPELVWVDMAQGIFTITRNAEHCLFYDRPITADGVTASDLLTWWSGRDGTYHLSTQEQLKQFQDRLVRSCPDSPPERILLRAYWAFAHRRGFAEVPAIFPQVYLHYDPVTQEDRDRNGGRVIPAQVRDFMLFLPGGKRIILEVDGKTHYTTRDGAASPEVYAKTVKADRTNRLRGYEVYRFGGFEFLDDQQPAKMLADFFADLTK